MLPRENINKTNNSNSKDLLPRTASSSSISSNSNSSRRLKSTTGSRRSSVTRRMSHWFLCRRGVRHWFRIASTRQKYELFLVIALSVVTTSYYLFFNGSNSNNKYSNNNNNIRSQSTSSNIKIAVDSPAESRLSQLERDVSAVLSNVHLPHLPLLTTNLNAKNLHEPLDFEERNFLPQDFDPDTDLSKTEWALIAEQIQSLPGKKLLLAWPTIPVPYKGSDSRAVDAIRFLSKCGFDVDLIY